MSTLGGLLALGRRFHAQTFTSTVTIRRAGPAARDPATGQVTPTWATIYTGPAELKISDAQPSTVDAAGQRLAEQRPLLKLPATGPTAAAAAAVAVDDVGTVIGNEHDPLLAGLVFRVAGIHGQSNATARRLPVEVLSHG